MNFTIDDLTPDKSDNPRCVIKTDLGVSVPVKLDREELEAEAKHESERARFKQKP